MRAGEVYVAVPDYHLTVEREGTRGGVRYVVGLSQEPPECFSRPAVDVLFETAAVATEGHLIGVILTGANDDGARGAACLKRWGGRLLVQDPTTAEWSSMPAATLAATVPDLIGTPSDIGRQLCILGATNERSP
jgi:two-component system chemotaxis response regulator CheB